MWYFIFLCGVLAGGAGLAALEALLAYVLLRRLIRKWPLQKTQSVADPKSAELDPHQSLDYFCEKKGFLWILEADKVPIEQLGEKGPKEQRKKKKEVIDVTPVRKFGNLNNGSLLLTDPDGSIVSISLTGCKIEAVSSGTLASKKWSKRFPIRVESKTSAIYNTSKTICIFVETSWDKESWCKALRFASSENKQKQRWFINVHKDFQAYLTSLNAGYPYFIKPSGNILPEPLDRMSISDESASSKVRMFLKKLAKKSTKGGVDSKGSLYSQGRNQLLQGSPLFSSKLSNITAGDGLNSVSQPTSSRLAIQNHVPLTSEADSDDRIKIDEGTLCWNLVLSRFFFDAKGNADFKNMLKNRIQRTLSNMRIPSYIGEVICSDLELGSLPPYINAMRVHPMDLNEVWTWEIDLHYSDGIVLNIETRLDVRDQELQKEMVGVSSESSSIDDDPSESLEGLEVLEQLNLPTEVRDTENLALPGDTEHGGTQADTSIPRWKTILQSVAKQVSQVPLSFSLRVSSLRGTLRFQIKPPPSDQLWFGFTSAPDLEIDLETSVGERRINNIHVATFLVNRLKQSLRESMVLPNCESIYIPWMLAEKNDWVPVTAAPFIFRSYEPLSSHGNITDVVLPSKPEPSGKASSLLATNSKQPLISANNADASAIVFEKSSSKTEIQSTRSLHDLKVPLISAEQFNLDQRTNDSPSPRSSASPARTNSPDDDAKFKKMGRRAKMLDLGKKMGEKLEEKRRHLEEKGRNIVEKMRNQ